MPPIGFEVETVKRIAREFEKLARILRAWPRGTSTSARGTGPSGTILASMRKVNARLGSAAARGTIRPVAFDAIGREFGTIGAALRRAGAAPKRTAKKATTRKTARR